MRSPSEPSSVVHVQGQTGLRAFLGGRVGGRLGLLLLAWLVTAMVAGIGVLLVPYAAAPEMGYGGALLVSLAHWAPWVPWAMLIFAVGDRVPLERGRWTRALAVHVPLSVLTSLLMVGVITLVDQWLGVIFPGRALTSHFVIQLRGAAEFELIIYWGVVGAHAALRWHEAFTAARVASARLETDLAQATLRALQAQLNPHFLFNALNSVVSLIEKDPASAQRMLVRLSELLRATLAASDASSVTVAQELDLVTRYLDIERIRFGDRLTVQLACAPEAREARVPALVLQPLVENAIVHGLSQRPGPGRVEVRASVEGGTLRLAVRDDGPGFRAAASRRGAGIGLGNLRARLARLYGEACALEAGDHPDGGALVEVSLPLSVPGAATA